MTLLGILLGHIVCKEGIKVDFTKTKIILDLKPPVKPKQVRVLLAHTGYYRKFIRYYSDMTYPLKELLREDQKKTTFVCEFGSFSYRVMPFGLKNAPTVFSRIMV